MRNLSVAALLLVSIALGCVSATEPLMGPVGVQVSVESVSLGAQLPVRLRIQHGGDWYVNPCGQRLERLVDGEWMRPLPLPPVCDEVPNVAIAPGSGTAVNVLIPEDYPPGTYRVVFLVMPGVPFDHGGSRPLEEELAASNRFRVNPLF